MGWRTGRDSNPRYSCPYAAFRVRCFRPLSHLSIGTHAKRMHTVERGGPYPRAILSRKALDSQRVAERFDWATAASPLFVSRKPLERETRFFALRKAFGQE